MYYRSTKQRDGTYNIEQSRAGCNWEIIYSGVRGCNVDRVINRLCFEDMYPSN